MGELIRSVVTVDFSELDTYLASLPENTKETAYELNIINIPIDKVGDSLESGTLGSIISSYNNKKFLSLEYTTIPYGVTDMTSSFGYCFSLVKAPTIPDGVTTMESCFYYCTSLVEAPIIPNGVTNLFSCFGYCTSLVNAPVIPDGVEYMGYCFYRCASLVEAPIIPNGVIELDDCFSGCTTLIEAPVIPNSVTKMGSCFSGCTSLIEAPTIPNSVTDMASCFFRCTSLVNAPIIPNSVSSMSNCFYDCTSLQNIDLWEAYPLYYYHMLFGCTSLEKIGTENEYHRAKVNSFLKNIQSESSDDIPQSINLDTIVQCDNNIVPFENLDDYLTVVPENTPETAYDINITDIPIDKVTFSSMSGTLGYIINKHNNKYLILKDTVIPNGVTTMNDCFSSCVSLITAPLIPNSVTRIEFCFFGCTSLTEVPIIPNSVTSMLECFKYCTSLIKAPVIPDSVNVLNECFFGCTSLTEVPVIPDGVIYMEFCFADCTSLRNIDLWKATPSIYEYMFNNCTSLEKISTENEYQRAKVNFFLKNIQSESYNNIPQSVNIDDVVQCDNNVVFMWNLAEYLTLIPANTPSTAYEIDITEIKYDEVGLLLKNNQTKYISLNQTDCYSYYYPNSVPTNAFQQCNNLVGIKGDFSCVTDGPYMFYQCLNLINVDADFSSLRVAQNMFNGCNSLMTINSESLERITDATGMFNGCRNLQSIDCSVFGNVVHGDYMFYNCQNIIDYGEIDFTSLNTAEFMFYLCAFTEFDMSTMENITEAVSMFYRCTNLEKITNWSIPLSVVEENPSKFEHMFDNCSPNLEIKIGYSTDSLPEFNLVRVKTEYGKTIITKQGISDDSPESIETTNTVGDEIEFSNLSDEVVVDSNITNEQFQKMLKYKYQFGKTGLDPEQKNFVLYAQKGSHIEQNIAEGGGGGGGTPMDLTPLGTIIPFTGDVVPTGYLPCLGGLASRTTYSDLFRLIGTTYGEGDGVTSFGLPDLRGRFIEGSDENSVGQLKDAGLPNIKGASWIQAGANNSDATGAFTYEKTHTNGLDSSTSTGAGNFFFDASNGETDIDGNYKTDESTKVYGKSDTVQPASMTCIYIIKAVKSISGTTYDLVDDSVTSSVKTWSSERIDSEIVVSESEPLNPYAKVWVRL